MHAARALLFFGVAALLATVTGCGVRRSSWPAAVVEGAEIELVLQDAEGGARVKVIAVEGDWLLVRHREKSYYFPRERVTAIHVPWQ